MKFLVMLNEVKHLSAKHCDFRSLVSQHWSLVTRYSVLSPLPSSSPSIPANIALAVEPDRLLEQIEQFGVCTGVP